MPYRGKFHLVTSHNSNHTQHDARTFQADIWSLSGIGLLRYTDRFPPFTSAKLLVKIFIEFKD